MTKRTSKPGTVTKIPGGFTEPAGPQKLQTTGAARVGAAFVKRLKDDPEFAADWKAIKAKFRAMGEVLRSPEVMAEFEAAEARMNTAFQEAGLEPPDSIEEWMELGRVVGIPRSEIGTETLGTIYDEAIISSKREKWRAKLLAAEMLTRRGDGGHPQPPKDAVREYSPPLDKRGFIDLRKYNLILENSDSEITRAKREFHAIEEPGSNWRRFRIPLNELRSRQWSYPSEWNPPVS